MIINVMRVLKNGPFTRHDAVAVRAVRELNFCLTIIALGRSGEVGLLPHEHCLDQPQAILGEIARHRLDDGAERRPHEQLPT